MSVRPRVLFVITGLSTGGAEVLLERIVPLLRPRAETRVLSLRPIGDVGRRMIAAGDSVSSCGMAVKWDPRGLVRLWREMRAFRPHIVHSHLLHASVLTRIMSPLAGALTEVSSIHNERFEHRWEYTGLRLTEPLCRANVCVGRGVAAAMIDAGVLNPWKTHVIPNGVDSAAFRPARHGDEPPWSVWGFPTATRVFGFVGRLEPQKDIANLLDAVQLLKKAGAPVAFVVVGDGSLRRSLSELSVRSGVEELVRFVGPRSDIAAVMRRFDAFVLPSAWEGLPVALLEAMSCGLPVVATDVGAARELIGLEGGLLVPPGDPEALAEAIRSLWSEPVRAATSGRRNRRAVDARYSLAANAEALARLYEGLLLS